MFEGPKEDKELGIHKVWIGAFVLLAIGVGFVGFRILNKPSAKMVEQAAAELKDADAVRDLKIDRAKMEKDQMGLTAVWLVRIVNKSEKYTYSNIDYQTDYMGPDQKVLVENKGTLQVTIRPNAEYSSEIRDVAYPEGVAFFKFKVTGAKAKVEY